MKTVMLTLLIVLAGWAGARAETNTVVTNAVDEIVGATNDTAAPVAPPLIEIAPANEPTVVTSDRLTVAYAENVGTFEGNVLAVDPRITLRADKVIAYFAPEGTNTSRQIQRLVAEGGVVINQDDRKATGEHAEYIASEGKIILSGHPEVVTPEGQVSGDKITFWHGTERIEVDSAKTDTNRTRLIFYPGEGTSPTE